MRQSDSNNLDRDLVEAASGGDCKQVDLLLSRGADVNAAGGRTALMFAAVKGHADVVEVLLNKGVDVNDVNFRGRTALMSAARHGHAAVVELLLRHGVDANAADSHGRIALMLAAGSGHADVVELLLSNGAEVNAADSDGWTALMLAAEEGYADVVHLLLRHGAEVPPELQGNAIIEAARTAIAEERAEVRVGGYELLDQQQTMPLEIAELCVSYVSDIPVYSKEFVSAVSLRAEQADEKQQSIIPAESAFKQIMTN